MDMRAAPRTEAGSGCLSVLANIIRVVIWSRPLRLHLKASLVVGEKPRPILKLSGPSTSASPDDHGILPWMVHSIGLRHPAWVGPVEVVGIGRGVHLPHIDQRERQRLASSCAEDLPTDDNSVPRSRWRAQLASERRAHHEERAQHVATRGAVWSG